MQAKKIKIKNRFEEEVKRKSIIGHYIKLMKNNTNSFTQFDSLLLLLLLNFMKKKKQQLSA